MIHIIDHPLVSTNLTILRNENTSVHELRAACRRIGYHLAIEAAGQTLSLRESTVDTPFRQTTGYVLDNQCVMLPVMRAGLVLLDPFLEMMPDAGVGYIGIHCDYNTKEYREYYFSVPKPEPAHTVFVMDVVLATGYTATTVLSRLQLEGYENIVISAVIAAPEGVEKIRTEFPDVKIITASLDQGLNDNGSVNPGIGNISDRLNRT